ncbi:MAG: radical SAM family heme chaperone HemW [Heliobacteriaceae bacterium]|jgi:oxygen-independent coproporphyrinogen-3 oxidase|nr:radical SAM family heme chaperone HemW [Heliobacteriaceae bacterium]
MPKNVYIHIPFCRQKCKYCSFVSFTDLGLKKSYLAALKKEILHHYQGEVLDTLYFGGGTPSILEPEEIRELIGLFNVTPATEITLEMNPEDCEKSPLDNDVSVNRISIGCQTFDEGILKEIGRRHSAQEVKEILRFAQNDVSFDFIYGLPGQTIEGFEQDLRQAVSLGVKHISLYGLKIDEDCYFAQNPPKNLPDADTQADMYLKAVEILTQNGYEHYEISNFSLPGYNSRHNMNYWNNGSYYGFGVAAHGYITAPSPCPLPQGEGISTRYSNPCDLQEYLKNPLRHESEHIVSAQEQLEEEIFLGFRRIKGINKKEINEKFDINFDEKYAEVLAKYPSHILKTEHGYRLSLEGILLSNTILAEFLLAPPSD